MISANEEQIIDKITNVSWCSAANGKIVLFGIPKVFTVTVVCEMVT